MRFALRRSLELSKEHDEKHDELDPVPGCVKCQAEIYLGMTEDMEEQVEQLDFVFDQEETDD